MYCGDIINAVITKTLNSSAISMVLVRNIAFEKKLVSIIRVTEKFIDKKIHKEVILFIPVRVVIASPPVENNLFPEVGYQ